MKPVILRYNDMILKRIRERKEDLEYEITRLKKPCEFCIFQGHPYASGGCADTQCGRDNLYWGFRSKDFEEKEEKTK